MLDAYSVRKAVPRIVIAVIGINLSFYLCVAAIDLTSIVAKGLMQLLTTPFLPADGQLTIAKEVVEVNAENTLVGTAILAIIFSQLLSLGLIGVITTVLFPVLVTVALIGLAVLFTLVIRLGLIIFLSITSPVAIACYVLPGTEKYFQKWGELFVKTLMVYPIIAAIFAMSNVLGFILLSDASTGSQSSSIINPASMISVFAQSQNQSDASVTLKLIAAILVLYAPLVLIPFAFKLAGGAIGAVMNATQGAAGSRAARFKERRGRRQEEIRAQNFDKMKSGTRFSGSGFASKRANRFLQTGALAGQAGLNPMRMRSNVQAARSASEIAQYAKTKENAAAKPVLANDTLMEAAMHGDGTLASAKAYLQKEKGQTGTMLAQNLATIDTAQKAVGARNLQVAATGTLPSTKTGYMGENGDAEMLADSVRVAGGNRGLEGFLMNEQRNSASSAGRFDLTGYGFGKGLGAQDEIRRAYATGDQGTIDKTIQEQSDALSMDSLTHLSSGQIMGGHHSSVRRMMRTANKRVDHAAEGVRLARESGNEDAILGADRGMKQTLALSANLIDAAAQVGGESAMIAADSHQTHAYKGANGETVTVNEQMESIRDDAEFGQMRRELMSRRGMTPEQAEQMRLAGVDPGDVTSTTPPDITQPRI